MSDLTKCNLCQVEWPNHSPACAYVQVVKELHRELEETRDKLMMVLRAVNIHKGE